MTCDTLLCLIVSCWSKSNEAKRDKYLSTIENLVDFQNVNLSIVDIAKIKLYSFRERERII